MPSHSASTVHHHHHQQQQQHQQQHSRGLADKFASSVTRQAVAQAALAVGCKHTHTSVLDALTDLVRDYIMAVGVEAQAKAEAGGRTRVTILDVLAALEGPQQEGGRDRYELDWRSLRNFAFRGDVTQLDRPEAFQWYQPFHTHIPPFPVPSNHHRYHGGLKRARPPHGGGGGGEDDQEDHDGSGGTGGEPQPRPTYVPAFLPPFPPEHTFRKTGIKAAAKSEDPAVIQKHRIATKQLIFKAMEKTGKANKTKTKREGDSTRTNCKRESMEEDEDQEELLFSSSPR